MKIIGLPSGPIFDDIIDVIEPMTVLEIGCGIRPVSPDRKTTCCVEPFLDYIERIRVTRPNPTYIHKTWSDARGMFEDRSFDVVVALDVIEHMDREDGLTLRKDMERISKHLAIVFTPYGFKEQSHPDGVDAWGMGGGAWQEHRSGWIPCDFPDWEIITQDDAFFAFFGHGRRWIDFLS